MGQCKDCWWYSDRRTGLCCHEGEQYLARVAEDGGCKDWLSREGGVITDMECGLGLPEYRKERV